MAHINGNRPPQGAWEKNREEEFKAVSRRLMEPGGVVSSTFKQIQEAITPQPNESRVWASNDLETSRQVRKG